jgi:hypothetical protein
MQSSGNSTSTISCSWLQEGCAIAKEQPLENQLEQIYGIYGFFTFGLMAMFVATCRMMYHFKKAPAEANQTNRIHSSQQKTWRDVLFVAAIMTSLVGATTCALNMSALQWNAQANSEKSENQFEKSKKSFSNAFIYSAAFDVTYSVQFFFGILTQIACFEYLIVLREKRTEKARNITYFQWFFRKPQVIQNSLLKSEEATADAEANAKRVDANDYFRDQTRRTIRLGAPIICNVVGIVFRCLAAYYAGMTSEDESQFPLPGPNFKFNSSSFKAAATKLIHDFDTSRYYVAIQLICGCVSQLFVVVMLCIERHELNVRRSLRDAEHADAMHDDQELNKRSKQDRTLTLVIITAIIRFSQSIIEAIASMESIHVSKNCTDPCGNCQGCWALLWSYSVFVIYPRAILLHLFEPLFILFVMICIHKSDDLKST